MRDGPRLLVYELSKWLAGLVFEWRRGWRDGSAP